MLPIRHLATTLLLLAALLAAPTSVRAETYHACAGFIDTLPATITTQGTWCLRHDLSTAITSGNAITIATNNVTIDCNDFKLGGLAAGEGTQANGIRASLRLNIAIRNCALRGFRTGVRLEGGAGHLVEDNRVEGSTAIGLWVDGDNSIVRRNRVTDTGGPTCCVTTGIIVQGDGTAVIENTVAGVIAEDAEAESAGIFFNGYTGLIRGNHVTSILPGPSGVVNGMKSNVGYLTIVEQNVILNPSPTAGRGIDVNATSIRPVCLNNRVRNFTVSAYDTCIDGGGNFSN